MRYISTRGQTEPVSFSEAVALGLAPDGGLFLPETLPDLADAVDTWLADDPDYATLCRRFFGIFANDIPGDILDACVADAYTRFRHPEIAPLRRLDSRLHLLELFHGPTLAFKDFALQLLGNLYEAQIERTGKPINVLGATSGDTGAAAIHGLLGRKGVRIFILYPDGRVSPLQERQMTCTGAGNVFPLAVDGTFDDAQAALKETFADAAFRAEFELSAINSINLARVMAQCVYYLWAWHRLPAEERDHLEFVVPTGNFGNILAGWLMQRMGAFPDATFCLATNQNDILWRLFQTGRYEVDQVAPSLAPSMDIQVASNFERFIYYMLDEDAAGVRTVMSRFKETGRVTFDDFRPDTFSATRTSDTEIRDLIARVHREYGVTIDPHTACGFRRAFDAAGDGKSRVLLATADPAKFPDALRSAIGRDPTAEALEALKDREIVRYPISAEKPAIEAFIREHGIR